MQKLVIGMQSKRENGFTLIEILVVVFIIGITLGFALLSFGDFGNKRRILMSAEQFVNYVKFIQQQAILGTNTLGIAIKPQGYQVFRFQASSWQAMTKKKIFNEQFFPKNTVVQLENGLDKRKGPQIIINASGDMNIFTLNFGSTQQQSIAKVIGYADGSIHLKKVFVP